MVSEMRLVLVLLLLLFLSSCSALSTLVSSVSPGIGVNANVQAGKTNSQTLGQTQNIAPTVTLRPNSRVDRIDQSVASTRADNVQNQTINETPLWIIILLVLGWLLPSPNEIGRWISNLFKRKE